MSATAAAPTAVSLRSLRHAAVDLAALAFALFAVASEQTWAFYVVAGYTGLMLVMKLGAYVAKMKPARPADAPPDALYHVVYGAMVLVFLAGQWWITAGAWAVVWGLSFLAARR